MLCYIGNKENSDFKHCASLRCNYTETVFSFPNKGVVSFKLSLHFLRNNFFFYSFQFRFFFGSSLILFLFFPCYSYLVLSFFVCFYLKLAKCHRLKKIKKLCVGKIYACKKLKVRHSL